MKMELNEEELETNREILNVAWKAYPNDAGTTFKHIRLLKNFGVIKNRELLCHICVQEVIDRHAETCENYKKYIASPMEMIVLQCPESHYNYNTAREATWMVNDSLIYKLEKKSAKFLWDKEIRDGLSEYDGEIHFDHVKRGQWLEETFPDISEDVRFNPWMGFLCDRHIGSMKQYANRI